MLRYVSGGEPESLDPAVSNSQPDARIYLAIYDALIDYEPKTMEAIPSVAKSWEINEEGTEYIFHLRDNAKWSDGTPITARAMLARFEAWLAQRLAATGETADPLAAHGSVRDKLLRPAPRRKRIARAVRRSVRKIFQ